MFLLLRIPFNYFSSFLLVPASIFQNNVCVVLLLIRKYWRELSHLIESGCFPFVSSIMFLVIILLFQSFGILCVTPSPNTYLVV